MMKFIKILGCICLTPVCIYLLSLWWTKEIGNLELFLVIFIGGFLIICGLALLETVIGKKNPPSPQKTQSPGEIHSTDEIDVRD